MNRSTKRPPLVISKILWMWIHLELVIIMLGFLCFSIVLLLNMFEMEPFGNYANQQENIETHPIHLEQVYQYLLNYANYRLFLLWAIRLLSTSIWDSSLGKYYRTLLLLKEGMNSLYIFSFTLFSNANVEENFTNPSTSQEKSRGLISSTNEDNFYSICFLLITSLIVGSIIFHLCLSGHQHVCVFIYLIL